jgi:hypothetical protein
MIPRCLSSAASYDLVSTSKYAGPSSEEWAGIGGKLKKGPILPALTWPLWGCFGATILTGSFFKFINDLIQFCPAVVLGGFLQYIAGKVLGHRCSLTDQV